MEDIFINDLMDKYPEKTILEINDILLNNHIDNKHIKIKVNCCECGKEIITTPGTYRKQKNFRCDEHRSSKPKGKDSPFYNKIKSQCSCCGSDIFLTPYQLNKTNKFGDSNNFCSQKCYWAFRSEYYCGEKGAMYQHNYTEEQLNNVKLGLAKGKSKSNRLDTKPQLVVNGFLDDAGINYIREYAVDYYACDIFLPNHNLIIEVMGDYWHCNPIKYNDEKYKIDKIQFKTITKDKQKKSFIYNHYDYKVLYLWENDILHNHDICKKLIGIFLEKAGDLKNYHSFNYVLTDNTIELNENIIVPYQDMNIEQYKHLIKE